MTVKELIDFLSNFDKDMRVELQYQDEGGCYDGSCDITNGTVESKDGYEALVLY